MGKQDDSEAGRENPEQVPVFNKRLFAAHGSVVLTAAARSIMARNALVLPREQPMAMTKSELHAIGCVVDALTLIHKGQAFVKEALGQVVTLENYGASEYVEKQSHEVQLSCYYIINGAVMVTYDVLQDTQTRSVHQPDIIYNHGAGDFLGIVSPEGIHDDLSPPATVYTKEPTDFIRIDRQRFHQLIDIYKQKLENEKMAFIRDPRCILSQVSMEVVERILPYITKMEASANKTVLLQDEESDDMYFVVSGRCQLTRKVHMPEIAHNVTFHLDTREPYSFFAEECILSSSSSRSQCIVTTTTHTVFFKLNRAALEIVFKEQLHNILSDHAHKYPSDEKLKVKGYTASAWNQYKYTQIKRFLTEVGADHKLKDGKNTLYTNRTPLSEVERYKENLLRFTLKGAGFERLSPKVTGAYPRQSRPVRPLRRPKTMSARCSEATEVPLRGKATISADERTSMMLLPTLTKKSRSHSIPTPAISHNRKDGSMIPRNNSVESSSSIISNSSSSRSISSKEFMPDQRSRTPRVVVDDAENAGSDLRVDNGDNRTEEGYKRSEGQIRKLSDLSDEGNSSDDDVFSGSTHGKLYARSPEPRPEHDLHGRESPREQEKSDVFMASSVLVSMRTEDIVRKAKAIAEKSKSHLDESNSSGDSTNKWYTSLHEENERAKNTIVANKYRSAFLRRRMSTLARRRQKESDIKEHQMKQMPKEEDDLDEMALQLANSSSIMMKRSKSLPLSEMIPVHETALGTNVMSGPADTTNMAPDNVYTILNTPPPSTSLGKGLSLSKDEVEISASFTVSREKEILFEDNSRYRSSEDTRSYDDISQLRDTSLVDEEEKSMPNVSPEQPLRKETEEDTAPVSGLTLLEESEKSSAPSAVLPVTTTSIPDDIISNEISDVLAGKDASECDIASRKKPSKDTKKRNTKQRSKSSSDQKTGVRRGKTATKSSKKHVPEKNREDRTGQRSPGIFLTQTPETACQQLTAKEETG